MTERGDRSVEWLREIVVASAFIRAQVAGRTVEDDRTDEAPRSIVARKRGIVRENVVRLRDHYPLVVAQLSAFQQVIGLRNRIAHAYGSLDHPSIREFVQTSLLSLVQDVEHLLRDRVPDDSSLG